MVVLRNWTERRRAKSGGDAYVDKSSRSSKSGNNTPIEDDTVMD